MKVKEMILVALFAALTAVGAFIQIPLGTVPITLQFLFTALSGIMLGSRLGALSQLVYVVIGLIGVPVFAGGIGGITAVVSPSFGYLIGFILAAYIIGKISEGYSSPRLIHFLAASIGGAIVIYLIGVPYLYYIVRFVVGKQITLMTALKTGFYVFIPGDLMKCIIVAAIGSKVVPVVKKAYL